MELGHRVCTDTSCVAVIKVQVEDLQTLVFGSNPLVKQGESETEPPTFHAHTQE